MADIFPKEKRSLIMAAVKNKGSKIEKRVKVFLRENGLKYRSHPQGLPGKPDLILLDSENTVVFVDSCFWHGCRYHRSQPKSNVVFWKKKIARNIDRDKEINKIYKKMDRPMIRLWEHELDTKTAEKKLRARLDKIQTK